LIDAIAEAQRIVTVSMASGFDIYDLCGCVTTLRVPEDEVFALLGGPHTGCHVVDAGVSDVAKGRCADGEAETLEIRAVGIGVNRAAPCIGPSGLEHQLAVAQGIKAIV